MNDNIKCVSLILYRSVINCYLYIFAILLKYIYIFKHVVCVKNISDFWPQLSFISRSNMRLLIGSLFLFAFIHPHVHLYKKQVHLFIARLISPKKGRRFFLGAGDRGGEGSRLYAPLPPGGLHHGFVCYHTALKCERFTKTCFIKTPPYPKKQYVAIGAKSIL